MVEIEAKISYKKNCDYLASEIVKKLTIEQREVDIKSTITIINHSERKLEPTGRPSEVYLNNSLDLSQSNIEKNFTPYFNDKLKLEIEITIPHNGENLPVKYKDVNVYLFGPTDDRTKLTQDYLLAKLCLDNHGQASLDFQPKQDCYIVIEYNETTYFKRKAVERFLELHKIPTRVSIQPVYKKELPKFIKLGEAVDLAASVRDTYGRKPQDGVITFLSYRIHDIDNPEDGFERVIGNPLLIENGQTFQYDIESNEFDYNSVEIYNKLSEIPSMGCILNDGKHIVFIDSEDANNNTSENVIKARGTGYISYSPIQFFNQDSVFSYDYKTGDITHTHNYYSDYEVTYENNTYDLVQTNSSEIHKLRHTPSAKEISPNNWQPCPDGDDCLYYDYQSTYGKLINNIEIIKAVYNYDNDLYGGSWKYYEQHSAYTSLSVLIPGELTIDMDIESETNDDWQIKEDGLYHYTTNDKIIFKSKLLDVDGEEIDLKEKYYGFNIQTLEYEEITDVENIGEDEYGLCYNTPNIYDDIVCNIDGTEEIRADVKYTIKGSITQVVGNEIKYHAIEPIEITGYYDENTNIFTGEYDAKDAPEGLYTVVGTVTIRGTKIPVRTRGYEDYTELRKASKDEKNNARIFDTSFYEASTTYPVFFQIEKVGKFKYTFRNVLTKNVNNETIPVECYYPNENYNNIEIYVTPSRTDDDSWWGYLDDEIYYLKEKINNEDEIIASSAGASPLLTIQKENITLNGQKAYLITFNDTNNWIRRASLGVHNIKLYLENNNEDSSYTYCCKNNKETARGVVEYKRQCYEGEVNITITVDNILTKTSVTTTLYKNNTPIELPEQRYCYANDNQIIINKKHLSVGEYKLQIVCDSSGVSTEVPFVINKAKFTPEIFEINNITTGEQTVNAVIQCDGYPNDVDINKFTISMNHNVIPEIKEDTFLISHVNNSIQFKIDMYLINEESHILQIGYQGDENYETLSNTNTMTITPQTISGQFSKLNDNSFSITNNYGRNKQIIIGELVATSNEDEIRIPVITDIDGVMNISNEIPNWISYYRFEFIKDPKNQTLINLINSNSTNSDNIYDKLCEYYDNTTYEVFDVDYYYLPLQGSESDAQELYRQVKQDNKGKVLFTTYNNDTIF